MVWIRGEWQSYVYAAGLIWTRPLCAGCADPKNWPHVRPHNAWPNLILSQHLHLCRWCEQLFVARRQRHLFCSDYCRVTYHNKQR